MLYIYCSKDNKMTLLTLFIFVFLFSCQAQQTNSIVTGAKQLDEYTSLLEGNRVALVANQTSLVDEVHLVDTLLSVGINIVKVFAPEHGFRGKADAGAHIDNETDLSLIHI